MNEKELRYEMQTEIEDRVKEIKRLEGKSALDFIAYGECKSALSLAQFALKTNIFDVAIFNNYVSMVKIAYRKYEKSIK